MAQLRLLGARALGALDDAFSRASPTSRLGMLAVLEGLTQGPAGALVLRALEDPDPRVAARAAELAGGLTTPAAARALGRLSQVGPPLSRHAALEALLRLQSRGVVEALEPLLHAVLDPTVSSDLRSAVRASLRAAPGGLPPEVEARIGDLPRAGARSGPAELVERLLQAPDAEAALALAGELRAGGVAALPSIHEMLRPEVAPLPLRLLVEQVATLRQPASIPRLFELLRGLALAPEAPECLESRARVHLALAELGSRIAIYDLRELLQRRPPVAPELLLRAAEAQADASLLPALAGLCADAPEHGAGCEAAFHAALARDSRRAARQRPRDEHRAAWDRLRAGYTARRRHSRDD